jgi:hypothetical protein
MRTRLIQSALWCVQDLEMMKGSTVDSMSDAVEGADVMLYGVSLAYKESA